MYSKIVNPKTGRKVSVKSRLGKNILRKYLFILNGGAANERPLNEPPSVRGAAEGAPTAEVEAFRRHHYSPPVRHSRWSQPRRPQAIDETVRLDASTQGSAEEPPGEDGTAGCAYFPAATMLNPLCMCYKCSARRWAAQREAESEWGRQHRARLYREADAAHELELRAAAARAAEEREAAPLLSSDQGYESDESDESDKWELVEGPPADLYLESVREREVALATAATVTAAAAAACACSELF